MKRTFVAIVVVTIAVFAFGPALDACGDKSLFAGGIRKQRALAARYPASVLAYAPPTSRLPAASRELELQETLRKVGHKYHEVSTLPELRASAATGRFNIVIADVAQIAELQASLDSSASRVVLVPVAYKVTKAEGRELARQSRFLIKAPGRAVEYLTTIAKAVRANTASPRKG
jgi:hypothetical protein